MTRHPARPVVNSILLGRTPLVASALLGVALTLGCGEQAKMNAGDDVGPATTASGNEGAQTATEPGGSAPEGSADSPATNTAAAGTAPPADTNGAPTDESGTGDPPGPSQSAPDATSEVDPTLTDPATPPGTDPTEPGPSDTGPSDTGPAPLPTAPDPNDPASIPPGTGPLGQETTCDGKDDDLNGVIDDVDAAGDGVCDCLAIATLGLHGEWGEGDVFTGWLSERSTTPVVALADAELTADLLEPFQVLVIEDVSAMHNEGLSFSAAEAQVLWDWVRQGGGLMTLIGYSDAGEINNVNALLGAFSLAYDSTQVVQGEGAAVSIEEFFEHPVSKGVTQVGADNGYPTSGQGTTVAAQDGYDMGKAVVIGDGHVLVWGDEWVTYEDEWRGDTTYQVERFWLNTLDWLARANECHVPQP